MTSLFNDSEQSSQAVQKPKHWRIYFILFLLLASMTGFFLYFNSHLWQTGLELQTSRVKLGESQTFQANEVLFQAAGWVLPEPYSTSIPSQVEGLVKALYIIDGQMVKKGDLLLDLIDDDYRLAVKKVQNQILHIEVEKKKVLLNIPVLKAEKSILEKAKNRLETQVAKLAYAKKTFESAGEALSEFERVQKDYDWQIEQKKLDENEASQKTIDAKLAIITKEVEVLEAKRNILEVNLEQAELNLSRCQIFAPQDAMIQKVISRSGAKIVRGSDSKDSMTVAKIFNPKKLSVRIDVPLQELDKLSLGQACEVYLDFIKKPLKAKLIAISGEADFQKNTLEVRVLLSEFHSYLRPELLAQVKFLAPETSEAKAEMQESYFVEKAALILPMNQKENAVWILGLDSKLEKRKVVLGNSQKEAWLEVKKGLRAGERAVLNPQASWSEGQYVKKEVLASE